jgi:DnaK suppressor protein
MLDQQTIRERLIEQLDALTARHKKINDHLHNRVVDMPSDSQERAQYIVGDEVLDALDDISRAEISAIRGALSRMDEGTWEECASCGEPIGHRRLAALPTAVLCVECASAQEQRPR